jgi:hypothetical protein
MATKTTKASGTFTEEQLAEAARILADRAKAAREAESAEGLQAVACKATDADSNVLARCRFNAAGMPSIFGTAIMVDGGKRRLSVAISQGFTPGIAIVGGEAGDLAATMAYVAEQTPKVEAYLIKAYAAAAKTHTFRRKEKKK